MLLQGLFVPLTCPFYRDGALYLRKVEHNVARYSLGPAAGMVALVPGGEASALTDAEAASFLQAVGETARKEKVLLAGVERSSVYAACELARVAEAAGFDAVVLAPPPDWARLVHGQDARELVVFYQSVADRSPLPVVLWSDRRPPSLALPAEVVSSLASHPRIVGLLDADLDEERVATLRSATAEIRREVTVTTIFEAVTRRMLQAPEPVLTPAPGIIAVEALAGGTAVATATNVVVNAAPPLKTRTREVGFQLLSAGAAHGLVPLLSAGVAGGMPPLAASAPQGCFEAYAAWKDGDLALAAERAARLAEAEAVLQRLGPAGVKAGCDLNGYFGGQPRLPRLTLTAEQRNEVEAALSQVRN